MFLTGNTVIDALQTTVRPQFTFQEEILNRLDYAARRVILVTCHRRENYGQPMTNIMTALRRIADAFPDVELVYPVHLSPWCRRPPTSIWTDIPASTSSPRWRWTRCTT